MGAGKELEDNFIPEFFYNTEIFITGGSGVVGKALIEKLLRSCNVRRIYILLRPKKTRTIEERLKDICEEKIFRRLKINRADELEKLVPVPGDAVLPNLGITTEYAKLMENVSIIFHCAATVRFDEQMKEALRLNVGGVLEALKFAESLKHLKVFMHVSTFYSNPYLNYVEPKVYESPLDWKLCLRLFEEDMDADLLDTLTRKMIIGFPNTYTFTKNIAESLVNSYRQRLPVIIYRPSIVIFALSDPEPGYPPSMMGAMGLFVLLFAGILKSILISPTTRLDLTPQDICAKAMCFYAYKGAHVYSKNKSLKSSPPLDSAPVYMTSSAKHAPQTFQNMVNLIQDHNCCLHAPFEKCLLYPSAVLTSCRPYYNLIVYTMQLLPGLLVDQLLKLFGRKPAVMSIMRKAYISLEVMEPFRFNSWDSAGMTEYEFMERELDDTEFEIRKDLQFAGSNEGCIVTAMQMCERVREVLLKENPETIPKMRKILKLKGLVFTLLKYGIIFYAIRLVSNFTLNLIKCQI